MSIGLRMQARHIRVKCRLRMLKSKETIYKKDFVNPPSNYQLTVDTSGGTVTSAELLKKVFTNAKLSVGTSAGLVTRKAEDRIAKVTVEIYYEDETVFNEENRIVMVQTSKGV